jgi:hypothetical protein
MRYAIALVTLCAAALAGCSGPAEVAAAPPGVSYRVSGDDVGDANLRADRYCEQYSKRAVLNGINQEGGAHLATYSCR